MEQIPLFERLGERAGITELAARIVDNHLANPLIGTRYANASKDRDGMVDGVTEFLCTGLSGVPTYEGLPVADVHRGMNIDEAEFLAVLDDVMGAMASLDLGEAEQAEVLQILYSQKGDVVRL
jgi:hemoglobin